MKKPDPSHRRRPQRPAAKTAESERDRADRELFLAAMRELGTTAVRDRSHKVEKRAAKPRAKPLPSPKYEAGEDEQFLIAMRQLEVQPTSRRAGRAGAGLQAETATVTTDSSTPAEPGQPEGNRTEGRPQAGRQTAESREDEQFLAAMQELGAVPDKDRRSVPTMVDSVRRLRPAKLRQLPIDDRLDLHGQRVKEALSAVTAFVAAAARQRLRAVLIITGKGLNSPAGGGVLKRAVEQWIVGRGRDWVSGYGEAPREIGGRGALVLDLRRRRSGTSSGGAR